MDGCDGCCGLTILLTGGQSSVRDKAPGGKDASMESLLYDCSFACDTLGFEG